MWGSCVHGKNFVVVKLRRRAHGYNKVHMLKTKSGTPVVLRSGVQPGTFGPGEKLAEQHFHSIQEADTVEKSLPGK